jgi:hypothetical protein
MISQRRALGWETRGEASKDRVDGECAPPSAVTTATPPGRGAAGPVVGARRGRAGLRHGPGGRVRALERVCVAGRRGWPVAGTLLS